MRWHSVMQSMHFSSNVFLNNFWIALIKPDILNFLPYKLLCEIGLFLDIEELKTIILVCQLFCNIYLPIYLSCYKFSPGKKCFWLCKVQDFHIFCSYHRSQNLHLHASLSAFLNEINSNLLAKSLAYTLAHLPTNTFATISLCFTCHSHLSPQSLSKLLTALVPMQCSKLDISACLGDQHHSNISIVPIFTPMAFYLMDLKLDSDRTENWICMDYSIFLTIILYWINMVNYKTQIYYTNWYCKGHKCWLHLLIKLEIAILYYWLADM